MNIKRYEFLEKLETEIQKDDLTEFETLIDKYYAIFQDPIERTEKLKEDYPQFPLITEYLYESDLESEKWLDEHIESEKNDEDKNHRLLKEQKLLELADIDSEDFFLNYFERIKEDGLSDAFFEEITKTNDRMIKLFIIEMNKLMNVQHDDHEAQNKIRHLLIAIGKIRSKDSVTYLNNLLDDYMVEFEKNHHDHKNTKYINFDFFQILDSMVKQQDKSSIPHIYKARDFFPDEYTEYIVCQIAAGRIKKQKNEGYLPMEFMEIAFPSAQILQMLSGEEIKPDDTFDKLYGEYFEMKKL
jgi:hypothetical protein